MKLQLDANELFLAQFFKVGDISQKFKLHWKESDRNSSGNKDLQADLSLDRKANFFLYFRCDSSSSRQRSTLSARSNDAASQLELNWAQAWAIRPGLEGFGTKAVAQKLGL